ncbi:LTA synthase family protein, partial [Nitrospirota bacterium]
MYSKTESTSPWQRVFKQWFRDLKLWLAAVLYLMLFRMVLIWAFLAQMAPESGLSEIMHVMLTGLRFDSVVATTLILIPFLMGTVSGITGKALALTAKVRGIMAVGFFTISSMIFLVSYEYFREYGDQFNHFLFNFFKDDTLAILVTILKEYNPIMNTIAIIIFTLMGYFSYKKLIDKPFAFEQRLVDLIVIRKPLRWIVIALALIGLVVSLRGSIGDRPVQKHDASITSDRFLNKTVMNPYFAFKFAYMEYSTISSVEVVLDMMGKNRISDILSSFTGIGPYDTLEEYLLREARGTSTPPGHIFLVVLESYDAWPMLEKYNSLSLTNRLKDLGNRGVRINSFLPSSTGTINSLNSIITGMPSIGVPINYHPSSAETYSTSLPAIMKRLGYKTRFFYSGALSWQNIENFALAQGFDEVYGAPHMRKGVKGNEWGVDDEYLYDFTLKNVEPATPSFNLILTTTYHPPYDINV